MCYKEIEWKVPVKDVPLTNYGVVYDIREVPHAKAEEMVRKIEDEGAISKLEVADKGFFNPIMFVHVEWRRISQGNEFYTLECL